MPATPPRTTASQFSCIVWFSPTFSDPAKRWQGLARLLAESGSMLLESNDARSAPLPWSDTCWPLHQRTRLAPSEGTVVCFLGTDTLPAALANVRTRIAILSSTLATAIATLDIAARFDLVVSGHLLTQLAGSPPDERLRPLENKLRFLPPTLSDRQVSRSPASTANAGFLFLCNPGSILEAFASALRGTIHAPVRIHNPNTPLDRIEWTAAKYWQIHIDPDSADQLESLLAAATASGCEVEASVPDDLCLFWGGSTGSRISVRAPNAQLRLLAQEILAFRPPPSRVLPPLQRVFYPNGLAARWNALIDHRLLRPSGDDLGFHFPSDFFPLGRPVPPTVLALTQDYLALMHPWFDLARPGGAAREHLQLLQHIIVRETPSPLGTVLIAEIDELLGAPVDGLVERLLRSAPPLTTAADPLARLIGRAGAFDTIPQFRTRLDEPAQLGFAGRVARTAAFGAAHLFRENHKLVADAGVVSLLALLENEAREGRSDLGSFGMQLQLTLATAGPAASIALLRSKPATDPVTRSVHATQLAWFGHDTDARALLANDESDSSDSILLWLRGLAFATTQQPDRAFVAWTKMLEVAPAFFSDAIPSHPDHWMWQAFALTWLGRNEQAGTFIRAAEHRDILFPLKARRLVHLQKPATCPPPTDPRVIFNPATNPPIYDFGQWTPRSIPQALLAAVTATKPS